MKVTRTQKGVTIRLTASEAVDLKDALIEEMSWASIASKQQYCLVIKLWDKLFTVLHGED